LKRSILLFVVGALVALVMGFSALSAAAQSGMDNGGDWEHQSGYCNEWQKDWHQNDNGWWWYWWYRWCWSPDWGWYQDWDGWEWG
jgi:hypothetical protein